MTIFNNRNDREMNRIKKMLVRKGIKQAWLAKRLGKSFNLVNCYLLNQQHPILEVLNDMANTLGVDMVELILSSKEK